MSAYERPFDLVLVRGPDGRPALPGGETAASDLADRVRRDGGAGYDVRILLDDGERDNELFAELAGLLSHDVLATAADAVLRPGPDGPVPWLAHTPADWTVIQPPRYATALPGWFATVDGRVRPRTGTIRMPLPNGVVYTDRAAFVATRAAVSRWVPADAPLTVGVGVHSGRFRLTDYAGTTRSLSGPEFAAELADLWLYGGDLALWLAWPSGAAEQATLRDDITLMADALGATVWAPPVGGATLVGEAGLVARDRAGQAAHWRAYPPAGRTGPVLFGSDAQGRLVRGGEHQPTEHPATAPARVQPVIRRRQSGLDELPASVAANDVALELFLPSPWPADRVAREGLPSAERYVIGVTQPDDAHHLPVRVAPGGAVVDSRGWLIPAGWLDRTRLAGTGLPLTLRSTGADHGVDGLPGDVPRWPTGRPAEVYALIPEPGTTGDLLPVHRREPPARPGRRLARLKLTTGQAIDVTAGAHRSTGTPLLRTRLPELRADGVELALPRSAYAAATVTALFTATDGSWRRRPGSTPTTLAAVLP